MNVLQILTPRIKKRILKTVDFHRYYIDRILFEMVKVGKGREMAFINNKGAIRHIKAHALYYLKENFKAFHFYDNPRNIYYSLAHLENMPMFSFVPIVRKQQQEVFNQNFQQYFKGMDFGIDFDESCKYCEGKHNCIKHEKMTNKEICSKCEDYETNFDVLYNDVKRVKTSFDDYGLPYQLKFSGSGFHINIEWKYIKDCMDIAKRIKRLQSSSAEDCIALLKWFLSELSDIFNATSLDTSVTDIRRIWKMPYSIDIKTGNVALPLTGQQFRNFNFDIVKPENVIDTVRNRGLLERKGTSENLKNFMESFLLG
ncbi:hypothetical protein LCGC14_0363510 [marine sediment metagenome]|uniref:DNA primase small subunit PriS n=1 Tax=marine sediment metagenome TaxID=412755 RepID=A0A0F9TD75_9ZZZZ